MVKKVKREIDNYNKTLIWSINFTNENAMGKKSQVSCQGYKAKLMIITGIRKRNVVKITEKNVVKSRVWGIW